MAPITSRPEDALLVRDGDGAEVVVAFDGATTEEVETSGDVKGAVVRVPFPTTTEDNASDRDGEGGERPGLLADGVIG
jgi:hypothetical protein